MFGLWKNIISTESVDSTADGFAFFLWKNIISTESVDKLKKMQEQQTLEEYNFYWKCRFLKILNMPFLWKNIISTESVDLFFDLSGFSFGRI